MSALDACEERRRPVEREINGRGYTAPTRQKDTALREKIRKIRRHAHWAINTRRDLPPSVAKEPAQVDPVERKFIRLRDGWKSRRGHESSTLALVMHPAYQSIIGMGRDVVPLILRELASCPDRWFWALRAITEEDPVRPEDRGNSKAMTQAWLRWGKEQGYQW